jgi:hypothetical protein
VVSLLIGGMVEIKPTQLLAVFFKQSSQNIPKRYFSKIFKKLLTTKIFNGFAFNLLELHKFSLPCL